MEADARGPELSIIVPARNAARTIVAALRSVRASSLPAESYELIVVDDASDDETASLAARYADVVMRLAGRPAGPAYARNRGAEVATGALLAFVDSDVALLPETLPRLVADLARDPMVGAVSAGYGDGEARNFFSQYWNLLLRLGMQRGARGGAHHIACCAVVRRGAFFTSGLYDEWRFRTGCLEDVELGIRLATHGYRVLVSTNNGVARLSETSFADVTRAVWMRGRLLTRSLGYRRTRHIASGDVMYTLTRPGIPGLLFGGALALCAETTPRTGAPIVIALAAALICLVNLPTFRFFARERGLGFTVLAMPAHLVAQATAVAALISGWLLRHFIGDGVPDATTQAYAEVGAEMWPPVPRQT